MEDIQNVRIEELTDSIYVSPFRLTYEQNGRKKIWDCVNKFDSVGILLHNVSRDVLVFVKQFRPPVYFNSAKTKGAVNDATKTIDCSMMNGSDGITIELCAGLRDKPGKSAAEIAQEEVLEECGYDVSLDQLKMIIDCRSVEGGSMTYYTVEVTDKQKVSEGGGLDSEGELIETYEVPVKDAFKFVSQENDENKPVLPTSLRFMVMWYLNST